MIECRDIRFSYESGREVLRGVSFSIAPGESVGLIGANGAGKSTLMRILLGLLSPTGGEALIRSTRVEKKTLAEIRRTLGFVLQDSDNQMFMPKVWDDLMFAPLNYGLGRAEAERRAETALKTLGIEALRDRYNHKISGGEKRMAAIAVVLAMEPEAILMDEPTTALDPYNRRQVIRAVNALPQTKLIASHDLDMILECCSRVILLSGGRVVADGPAEEILRDQALLEQNRMELPLSLAGR